MANRKLPAIAALALLPVWNPMPETLHADVSRLGEIAVNEEHGVFLGLAQDVPGDFDAVAATLADAFETAGWQVLTTFESGVDRDDCSYRASVLVVNFPEYSTRVLGAGLHSAFALPVRIVVFQDENGTHVAAANPLSLNRTIVAEEGFDDESAEIVNRLRAIAAAAFPESVNSYQYGQLRDRGRIARTMGLIAGGAFTDKIETVTRIRPEGGEGLAEIAQRIYRALGEVGGSWSWDIRPVYLLDMADDGAVVIGVTGERMESKAFQIVGSGGNSARNGLACPGIDHAAAFPIELVLVEENDRIVVQIIDAMFRMKMYFEDAGKVKFAANMRMPGSIEDEIRDKIEESLY